MTVTWLALVLATAVLAVHNLGVERLPAVLYVPACLATTVTLVGLARSAGVAPDAIGLTGTGLGAGLAVGSAAALAVVLAAAVPPTRPLFRDRRMAGVGPWGTGYRALVRIPLGTVVVEEVAFRGVLLVLLDRLLPLTAAVAVSCLLFGLWHVVPVRATLRTNRLPVHPAAVAATVAAAGIAGLGFCWLRLGTDSLVAPALVHAVASASATVTAFVRRDTRPG